MSEQTDYRAIVERIAVILHGKVTDIDLLTVTVLAMKERNSRLERQRDEQPAPVVPERDQVRTDHAKWSQATFGSVGPVGPLKHLSKEALEAADAPGDLSEWADMQFLLWDAQRRAGITDEQITQAMIDKLKVNKARQWPEPKDGEPRQHIQAETDTAPPAPVVPDDVLEDAKILGAGFLKVLADGETHRLDPQKVIVTFKNESGQPVASWWLNGDFSAEISRQTDAPPAPGKEG